MNDNKNRPYTKEEKEIIFKMYQEGYNCKEIGEKLGKTNKAINKFLHRHNLNTNQSIYNKLTPLEIENNDKIFKKLYKNKQADYIYNNEYLSYDEFKTIKKNNKLSLGKVNKFHGILKKEISYNLSKCII